ncbi:MAG: sugar phosphate isomerase/epimerase, partial [Planctomycetes bacterium]|nr:sugar phosphate isomerase/epimerase [Planctomycetota bacterium]
MRAGMHSWSFREHFNNDDTFTIEKAIDITKDLGFDCMEIMAGKANCPPGDFASEDIEYLKGVKNYADKKGIEILSLATYCDFAYTPDEEWRLANIEYIKQWLGIAGALAVPNIRMCTG